jgi:amidase
MLSRNLQYLNVQTRKQGDATWEHLLPDLYEASISELQEGLDAGHYTSVDLVQVASFI